MKMPKAVEKKLGEALMVVLAACVETVKAIFGVFRRRAAERRRRQRVKTIAIVILGFAVIGAAVYVASWWRH